MIRADSSNKIGLGHVMRDMVLAEQFSSKGHQLYFVCLPLEGNAIDKIQDKGFEVIRLSTDSDTELVQVIESYKADLLIIDHYQIEKPTEQYLKQQTNVQLFVIDDLYKEHHCDFILNHNISGNKDRYQGKVPDDCLVLAGPQYALIRKEFREQEISGRQLIKNKKTQAFITFGGTDPTNLSCQVIDCLKDIEQVQLNIFTTTSNPNLSLLQTKVKSSENIELFINEANLASKMKTCDFAIVSPSMTSVESIFMELPLIVIKAVSNQQNTFNYLKDNQIFALEPEQVGTLAGLVKKLLDPSFYQTCYRQIKRIKEEKFNTQNNSIYELVIARTND